MGDFVEEITAQKIVELFEKDVVARKRFAELLVTEPDIRLALINAILRDVATKDYVDRKFAELRAELESLRNYVERRFSDIESRLSRVEGQLSILVRTFYAFLIPMMIMLIGIMLKLIFFS